MNMFLCKRIAHPSFKQRFCVSSRERWDFSY